MTAIQPPRISNSLMRPPMSAIELNYQATAANNAATKATQEGCPGRPTERVAVASGETSLGGNG